MVADHQVCIYSISVAFITQFSSIKSSMKQNCCITFYLSYSSLPLSLPLSLYLSLYLSLSLSPSFSLSFCVCVCVSIFSVFTKMLFVHFIQNLRCQIY